MGFPRFKLTVKGPNLAKLKADFSTEGTKKMVRELFFPGMLEAGRIFKKQIQKTINTRGAASNVAWLPNAPSTVRRKGFNFPLVHTGEYFDAFRLRKNVKKLTVVVGWKPGIHGPSGLPFHILGLLHEEGFIGPKGQVVPARPHIEPSFLAMEPKMNELIKKAARKLEKKVQKSLRAKKKYTKR